MKRSKLNPRECRRALSEGALSLDAFALVYDRERKDREIWKRRARDTRRYARTLRGLRSHLLADDLNRRRD